MRTPLWIVGLLFCATEAVGQSPRGVPARGPSPRVHESVQEALEEAQRRDQPAIIAVGPETGSDRPPLFDDPTIARASRSIVSLASLHYSMDDEFLRTRRILKETAPCLLVVDPHGNVLDRQPWEVRPPVLLASARNVLKIRRSTAEELAKALVRAEERHAAGDEAGVLKESLPWLARHYRGYEGLERLNELACIHGQRRLDAVAPSGDERVRDLEAVAIDFRDTRIEAEALYALAEFRDQEEAGRAASKALLERIVNELPWPQNAEVHERARGKLREFRRDEIQRRKAAAQTQQTGYSPDQR